MRILKHGISPPLRIGFHFSRLNFRRRDECRHALLWLDPRSGEKILDVGCGDGSIDWRISRTGAFVTGIDIHPARLNYAGRKYGDSRTLFLERDAESEEFPAGPFDKAISLCVLEHFRDDEQVLRRIARSLGPGGRLVLTADSLSNPGITPAEKERHRRRYAVNAFYTPDIVLDKLTRAGFSVERVGFVLDSAWALRLVRLSWRLDDLPRAVQAVRPLGYLALGAAYLVLDFFRRPERSVPSNGLTILVRATRRVS